MSFYKIYILDQHDHIAAAYDFAAHDDDSVLVESKKYSNNYAVEIWEQTRRVARVAVGGEALAG